MQLYLHAWETQTDPAREAKVRRLGTLTPDGVAPKGRHEWRAKDISWLDVADLVADADRQGGLEGESRRSLVSSRVFRTSVLNADL